MARRKDHTREELTELAIQSGRALVIDKGATALSARNVAKQMGYTPGTLYNLFENIDGLAAAINTRSMHDFAETLRVILQKKLKPQTRLHQIATAYIDFQANEPHLWTLLFATPIHHDSDSYRDAIHEVFDQVTEAMVAVSPNKNAARQNAKILWSTLHGLCLLRDGGKLDVGEADTTEELVKRFINQYFKK